MKLRLLFGYLFIFALNVKSQSKDNHLESRSNSKKEKKVFFKKKQAAPQGVDLSTLDPNSERHLEKCCVCLKGEGFREGVADSSCENHAKQEGCRKDESFVVAINQSHTFDSIPKDARVFPTSCRDMKVNGVFHANSHQYWAPIQNAKKLAERFQAKTICYDGVSCLIFNEVEKVLKCADDELKNDSCRYVISGNQNLGLILSSKTVFDIKRKGAHESPHSSSKFIVNVGGQQKTTFEFENCSDQGKTCGWVDPSTTSHQSPPNIKQCLLQGVVSNQECCRSNLKQTYVGYWSKPGSGCF